ncbi:MAG: hypothetical protein FJY77_01740 [Candidatus Altiarchaeales archaeon]|nr:hypothetical protein [Candidatus Altiarchaeales archaeon]
MDKKERDRIYEEYYGIKQTTEEETAAELSDFHKKVLKLLGEKGNTSDKVAEKLKVRENDVRRTLNELLIEGKVVYKKTTKRGKLAYIWRQKE